MKQWYHEILDDENNFLNRAARESLQHRLKKKGRIRKNNRRIRRSMPNIGALLRRFGENLQHMEISSDLRPAHNPQLFRRIVRQIWVLWIQRCFTGLETNPSYSRGGLADRSSVNDWQQNKEERKLKPTRREAMHTRLSVGAYSVCMCGLLQFLKLCTYCIHILHSHTHSSPHTSLLQLELW